jgi:hypothetical protein
MKNSEIWETPLEVSGDKIDTLFAMNYKRDTETRVWLSLRI